MAVHLQKCFAGNACSIYCQQLFSKYTYWRRLLCQKKKKNAKFERVAQNLQDFLPIKTLLFVLRIWNMRWIYAALEYFFCTFVNLQTYFFTISQYLSSISTYLCRPLLIIIVKCKLAHNSFEDSIRTKSVMLFPIHLKKTEVRISQTLHVLMSVLCDTSQMFLP